MGENWLQTLTELVGINNIGAWTHAYLKASVDASLAGEDIETDLALASIKFYIALGTGLVNQDQYFLAEKCFETAQQKYESLEPSALTPLDAGNLYKLRLESLAELSGQTMSIASQFLSRVCIGKDGPEFSEDCEMHNANVGLEYIIVARSYADKALEVFEKAIDRGVGFGSWDKEQILSGIRELNEAGRYWIEPLDRTDLVEKFTM